MSQIISDFNPDDQTLNTQIDRFFKQHISSKLLKRCGFYKESGFGCQPLLKMLFGLVFTHKNLWQTLETDETVPFKKNTPYRFLNQQKFHWEKLLLTVASKLVAYFNSMTSQDRATALVIDDSLLNRNRSKKVELLSYVFDHNSHKFRKGFRMLTLGWTDGSSFIPLCFRLLSSSNDSKLLRCAKDCDKRSQAYKRRKHAQTKAPDVVLDLLQKVRHIPARYVLFDSWFTMPKLVTAIKKMGREVIGMVKISEKIHYCYRGKSQNIKTIYSKIKKNNDRNNPIIGQSIVQLMAPGKDSAEEWITARLLFVRNTNTKKDAWLAVLCTDLSITAEEAIRIYGKRWDIEVFFKMCKSYLALGKEYQGRTFEAQVATTTIVFLRYMMIAESVRIENDQKTWGEIFFRFCDEVKDIKYLQSVKLLIDAMIDILRKSPVLTDIQAQVLIDRFIEVLPFYLKDRLKLVA